MSHFAVVVIGDDVERQLAAYDENIEVDSYSRKAYVGKDFERGTPEETAAALSNAYDQEYWVHDGEVVHWSTYNPQSKFDWYSVGGRWSGFFKLKEGATGEIGRPGVFDNEAEEGTADVVRKGDVDFASMRADSEAEAGIEYDNFYKALGTNPFPRDFNTFTESDVEERRMAYWAQPGIEAVKDLLSFGVKPSYYAGTREEFVQRARNSTIVPYAFVQNGEWFQRGEMGWWGISMNEVDQDEWNAKFNELIDSLPDDTILTCVDCHI